MQDVPTPLHLFAPGSVSNMHENDDGGSFFLRQWNTLALSLAGYALKEDGKELFFHLMAKMTVFLLSTAC